MATHNPREFAAALGAKLAARSRHVCMFLGAGVSRASGLPDIAGLQALVLSMLSPQERVALEKQLSGRTIEQAISRLRRIAELVTGDDTVDGLNAKQAQDLDSSICHAIVGALDIDGKNLAPMLHLAAWAARADYHQPLELFTVNYDLLLETALEALGVPYFDGFVGTLRARFRTELVEAPTGAIDGYVPKQFVRLWKLHGSVNWMRTEDQSIVRIGQPVPKGLPAAIYPSDAKYEESRRVPFVVLQDRLRRALYQPETLVIVTGYSFGDAHLNEILFDAATRRERSELVVFCYDPIPQVLHNRACTTPNIQVIGRTDAILGGLPGTWNAPAEEAPNVWVEDQMALSDFSHLSLYLARSTTRSGETPESIVLAAAQAAPVNDNG